MKLQLGEVVLLRMEFHQSAGAKVRPAVVLLDSGDDDFVAAPITSVRRISDYDLPIEEWRLAGLNVPSFIRVDKLTVLPRGGIARRIGSLMKNDRDALIQLLAQAPSMARPVHGSRGAGQTDSLVNELLRAG